MKSGIKIRSMHVDLHHRSAGDRTNTQPGNGGVPEETNDAMHELPNGCQ